MIIEIDEGKGGMSHLSVRLHSVAEKTSGKVYDRLNVSYMSGGEGVLAIGLNLKREWNARRTGQGVRSMA